MLLLLEERLDPELRLLRRLLFALARSLRPLPLLLRPLEALPRLLLLRDDDPGLEEEEELRDAMACSFGRLKRRPSLAFTAAMRSI